ncbi:helix-turn-helix transcriptional regulator [Sphaerochaeta sp. PS]|uniref:helix-turn-helix domain-containing protein n=1 Tax=Sphaerochaeta sp. PS TaxID=3076336 RepID=UPI0028A5278F|nr:helix-turn-helix transcriptional regulator [Sphaerochaeta sp. PS]MDT4763207.1 helix-turn-helix transcriptional regulator [Sphaerochaeta sp. PS]
MKLQELLTDEAVLQELGSRLARLRIESELTQEELATRSGVSKPTIVRLEKGIPVQTTTLIRVLRTLNLLSSLDGVIIAESIRPMETLLLQGKTRQRVRKPKQAPGPKPNKPFRWGDER